MHAFKTIYTKLQYFTEMFDVNRNLILNSINAEEVSSLIQIIN